MQQLPQFFEYMPVRLGVPPWWLTIGVLALGAAAGMKAAVELDYGLGVVWLLALGVLGAGASLGYWVDPGRTTDVARFLDPRASSVMWVRLCLLFVVIQLPAVTWRLLNGDPEIRLAKTYVATHAPAFEAQLRSRAPAVGAAGVVAAPPTDDAPPLLAAQELRVGESAGRVWIQFERSFSGRREVYRYDVDGGEWVVRREAG
jgi:hypothetical protein